MTTERVVTRVTAADGSHINVRTDELDKYMAAHPGAQVTGEVAVETAAEPEGDAAPKRKARADASE